MVLAGPDGTGSALEIGIMHDGHPLWTDDGLFFGGKAGEFFVSDDGTSSLPRSEEMYHELSRYPEEGANGFISFYSVGGRGSSYLQRLVVGNSEEIQEIDVPGAYMEIGQCQDKILGITTTELAPNLSDAASRMMPDAADPEAAETLDSSTGRATNTVYDVVVQAYPKIEDPGPAVLAVAEQDISVSSGTKELPCLGHTVYLPAFQRDHPDAEKGDGQDPKAGKPVLQAWDLDTGTRSVIVLHDEQGAPIDITVDESGMSTGYVEDTTYHFVTTTGKVFSTDLPTGLTHHDFTVPRVADGGRHSSYAVSRGFVYALDWGNGSRNPDLDFSRFEIPSGTPEHLFTLKGMGRYLKHRVGVWGIAINPEWEDQHSLPSPTPQS